MTTTSHFQSLSPDLLAHIVSFLNPIEEASYNRDCSGDRSCRARFRRSVSTYILPPAARWSAKLSRSLHHLRHLKFVLPCADSDPPQEVLTSDTLWPLLKVKEFITLDLHACPIDFDYRFLLDCADSWPNITTLRLGVRHGPDEQYSSVSLPALVPFVHRCPALKFLGLPLDTTPATFVRDLRNVPPSLCGGHPQHRVQALQVGQAAITDVSMVSGFLSGLFPNLLCVDATCSEDDFDEDGGEEEEARTLNAGRWEDVEEEIPHFVTVRRQERAWAEAHGQRVMRRGKTVKGGGVRGTPLG